MIGIIYKFTIIAGYKIEGHKPYYVGQHWERNSLKHFLFNKVRGLKNYEGSGLLWQRILKALRKQYGDNYRCLVKREVLFSSENISSSALSKMEEYYIKKECSLFSQKLGGVNLIAGSPVDLEYHQIEDSIKKMANTLHKRFSEHPELHPMFGKHHSEETKKHWSKIRKGKQTGKDNPFYGNHTQSGENNPFYGKHHSEETKRNQSKVMIEYYRTHVNPMKGKHRVISKEQREQHSVVMKHMKWITNGLENSRINESVELPIGWRYGRTRITN